MFKTVLIKGMLWNGEFFLGRFPKELSYVKRGVHKVVAIPAMLMDDPSVCKEVDGTDTNKEVHNLLPNTMITSPYDIKFDGVNYGSKRKPPFLNSKNPFTKEDQQKISDAMRTLQTYGIFGF